MTYNGTNVLSLFTSSSAYWGDHKATRGSTQLQRTAAWLEAENIDAMFKVVVKWFRLLESGKADLVKPDPYWNDNDYPHFEPLTDKIVDRLIEETDADFNEERSRAQARNQALPEFNRLSKSARRAFAQDLYRVMCPEKAIIKEAKRRVKAGEKIPIDVENTGSDDTSSNSSTEFYGGPG